MTEPVLILTDSPNDGDEQVIQGGLADYNESKAGYGDWRPLAALLRDEDTANTLGGMIGRTSYGLLFIDLVYLPEHLRSQDIGSRLLNMMEQEGIRRGAPEGGEVLTGAFGRPGEKHAFWRGYRDPDPG